MAAIPLPGDADTTEIEGFPPSDNDEDTLPYDPDRDQPFGPDSKGVLISREYYAKLMEAYNKAQRNVYRHPTCKLDTLKKSYGGVT